MGKKIPRTVRRGGLIDLELSEYSWEKLRKIAKKAGLPLQKVINLMLKAELDIIEYRVKRRQRLAKHLKIRFPRKFLYRDIL